MSYRLCLVFLSWFLICEQSFKRLKRVKLVQYFKHNEAFLLWFHFPAVLICGYSPSPQRSLGDPKSNSLWSDRNPHISPDKLHLMYNKAKLASLGWGRMLQAPMGCVLGFCSHTSCGCRLQPIRVWEGECWVPSLVQTMPECFSPVHSLKQCAILYLIST